MSAAPWGSAGILPISWAYVAPDGAGRPDRGPPRWRCSPPTTSPPGCAPHFPVLYTGEHGLVAHECIVDLRPLTRRTGVTVDDVAKRLIDYGFHAPTMSFPVAGTLMVEPTESEDLAELDRFCDAMVAIRAEIEKVAAGVYDASDNPLRGAPHTAVELAGDWPHAYSRARGGVSDRRACASTSTGRRSAGSTGPTATATWCAPARRSRTMSSRSPVSLIVAGADCRMERA